MRRDPKDCTCAGAVLVDVKIKDGKRVETWKPAEKECKQHPDGYDPSTGMNVAPDGEE